MESGRGAFPVKIIKLDESKRSKPLKRKPRKSAEIIISPVITKLDVPPDRILGAAIGKLQEVVIIGFDKNGNEWLASSEADCSNALYHLERAKYKLMKIIDDL